MKGKGFAFTSITTWLDFVLAGSLEEGGDGDDGDEGDDNDDDDKRKSVSHTPTGSAD